jgi:hypothetical protein
LKEVVPPPKVKKVRFAETLRGEERCG